MLTTHPLRFAVEIGMELALPWGSLGQAMLASLPPEDVEMVLAARDDRPAQRPPAGAPRRRYSPISTESAASGYADYFDPNYDVAGVAAPLFGAGRGADRLPRHHHALAALRPA